MNRLTTSQIAASLAVLLLASGGALASGADAHEIALPILAGLLVLAIATFGGAPASDAPMVALEPPDLFDHSELGALLEGVSDPLMLVERGRIALANRAAQRLLGAHIVNEDARIAIRPRSTSINGSDTPSSRAPSSL
jgi:two-component system phosphate regulon sensor histidine kinase PhoR